MSAFDSIITMDPYGLDGATVVWKSLDAMEAPDGPKVNHTNDPPEQAARCMTCPIPPERAVCGAKCWYRLGMDDPKQKKIHQSQSRRKSRSRPGDTTVRRWTGRWCTITGTKTSPKRLASAYGG